jgi:hypothetical protein
LQPSGRPSLGIPSLPRASGTLGACPLRRVSARSIGVLPPRQ